MVAPIEPDFQDARRLMVERQLRARGICSADVLQAMETIPREMFLPDNLQSEAYEDHPVPIGMQQTISQPYMVALMTEKLSPNNEDTILEVGTGSGYQTAILSRLAKFVHSIERIPELAEHARETLAKLGITNVDIIVGDGSVGILDRAPFDGILVTAGAPHVPSSLKEQLAVGGRLVIPVGSSFSQVLTIVTRTASGFDTVRDCGCVFVPLKGKEGW